MGLKIPRSVWMVVGRPCGKFNRDIIPAAADDGNTPRQTPLRSTSACPECDQNVFLYYSTQPTPTFSVIICQHHAPFPRWSVSAARRVRVVGLVGHGAEGSPSVCYVISSYDLTKTLVATSSSAGNFASQCVLDGSASLR